MSEPRPLSLLIAALGGEGGGVLTQWIAANQPVASLPRLLWQPHLVTLVRQMLQVCSKRRVDRRAAQIIIGK